ncbi:MAG: serine dehydrogenasease [Opitutus sp.]|nr:serine dehydrogenasease [Opitutus sp.]
MREVDVQIREALKSALLSLEEHFTADCIFYYGPIFPGVERRFREFIEHLRQDGAQKQRLIVFLNTPGGSAETVEKLVEIIRFNYAEVYFVVPDEAMSAGTIFCMSGDKIFMDYTSSLGPIDPQIYNGKIWVPALGYLDRVERMIQKSLDGDLSEAELVILQNQDLALLSQYEQAKNLTITLLKKWLVEYKFKDWIMHETNPEKQGQPVTLDEKQARAEEIATLLSNNKIWHSHGRMIGIGTLTEIVRLRIEDFSTQVELRRKISAYNSLITDYIAKNKNEFFLHSRCYFWHPAEQPR